MNHLKKNKFYNQFSLAERIKRSDTTRNIVRLKIEPTPYPKKTRYNRQKKKEKR